MVVKRPALFLPLALLPSLFDGILELAAMADDVREAAPGIVRQRLDVIGLERHLVGERVSHVAHRDAGPLVERLLEREHHQHAIHGAADGGDALGAPLRLFQ